MRIAREISRGLEAASNQRARRVVFGGSDHTFDELVERYHLTPKARAWSDHHRKAMERFRDFWLGHFTGRLLTDITVADVEEAAGELARSASTVRKYLVYMTGAYNFAVVKLKWLDARHDLKAVELPAPTAKGTSYTVDEVGKLLPALERVHPTAGWIGHVALQTGRRLSAIRAVTKEDINVSAARTEITFRKDKAGRVSSAIVVDDAHRLSQVMRLQPRWLNPSESKCREWLEAAESAAGIEHVPGRAWHGLKRTFATLAAGEAAAAKQSGTRRETLAGIYEQDWADSKVELARKISEAVHG